MIKLISIIAFLLFFATSFHSYSITVAPFNSCRQNANILSVIEKSMAELYLELRKNNFFVDDVEIIQKNASTFIIWPNFPPALHNQIKVDPYKFVAYVDSYLDELYSDLNRKQKVKQKNDPLVIREFYDKFNIVIHALQLHIQSYPYKFSTPYYCAQNVKGMEGMCIDESTFPKCDYNPPKDVLDALQINLLN